MSFRTLKKKFGIGPDHRLFLAAGQITLAVGILLWRIDHQIPTLDFLEGMLIGFSTIANLAGLIFYTRTKK